VASLSQGRTAAAQCGLFTYKSVPVIFEPPCISFVNGYTISLPHLTIRQKSDYMQSSRGKKFIRCSLQIVSVTVSVYRSLRHFV